VASRKEGEGTELGFLSFACALEFPAGSATNGSLERPHRLERQSRQPRDRWNPPRSPPVLRSRFGICPGWEGKGQSGRPRRAGVAVPPGFCVTTRAFDLFIASLPTRRLGRELSDWTGARRDARGALNRCARRSSVSPFPMRLHTPSPRLGERLARAPSAVRSSATAEDLPGASFCRPAGHVPQRKGEGALLEQ